MLEHETSTATHWIDFYFRFVEGRNIDLLQQDVRLSSVAAILDPIITRMRTASMSGRTTISPGAQND